MSLVGVLVFDLHISKYQNEMRGLGERRKGNSLSENEEVKGTEPVSNTVKMPSVISAMPSERLKYSSTADGSRTSGERRVTIIVGDIIRGMAWSANQPAVP